MTTAYPQYRDSGVKWLGRIPEHWDVPELGRMGSFFKGKGGTKQDEVEDGGIPCIRYGDLYTRYQFVIRDSRAFIAEGSTSNYRELAYGDVLFAGSGETLDEIGKSAVNLIRGRAFGGGDVIVFRPSVEVNAAFMGYAADSQLAASQKACMGRGVTIMHIYSGQLNHLRVPLPPLEEQRAIAVFLDRETARVDNLVAQQEQLLERLAEYRTALIANTVTRGLPPEAAMAAGLDPHPRYRDSGVEWLGRIPEHWEAIRLEAVAPRVSETVDPSLLGDKVVEHYSIPSLGKTGKPEVVRAAEIGSAKQLLRGGEVMVSRLNPRKARVIAVPTVRDVALASGEFVILAPLGVEQRFLTYVLLNEEVRQDLDSRVQSVTRSHQRVRPEMLLKMRVRVPGPSEQRAIAAFLDQETARVDNLVGQAELAVERLLEYRSALITHAVTGKMDVCGSVAHAGTGGG